MDTTSLKVSFEQRWKPEAPFFKNREEAGRQLGIELFRRYGLHLHKAVILGCVRGGLVVAREVSNVLKRFSPKLNIIVCRKIGHPANKELAIGAMGEDGRVQFVQSIIEQFKINPTDLEIQTLIRQEQRELKRRQKTYRGNTKLPILKNRMVIIVDDGMASGATVEAALQSVRRLSNHSARIIIAQPVASPTHVEKFIKRTKLDPEDMCVLTHVNPAPTQMWDIDDVFKDFGEVSDETVCKIMKEARGQKRKVIN